MLHTGSYAVVCCRNKDKTNDCKRFPIDSVMSHVTSGAYGLITQEGSGDNKWFPGEVLRRKYKSINCPNGKKV